MERVRPRDKQASSKAGNVKSGAAARLARPAGPRIGILGGTFDPPHNGHLLIAQQALKQLELAQVLFAPTRQPPHKLHNDITPVEYRIEMVQLAIAPYPQFVLSRIDVDRQGPTYTVDTIRLLRQQFGEPAELFFIMGMDSLANLLTWRTPDKLIELCKLAVFNRPGFTANMNELEVKLPNLRDRVVLLSASTPEIAAHELQQRIYAGLPVAGLIPESVAAFIGKHHLYRQAG